ncbi:MAG: hypothetical protein GX443_10445 [Deltaproteobacteria bacterium]|nr:hypothetical protein [Deltaproteobacteria bacterium]
MRRLMEKFQMMSMAVAFAEVGEWDEAKRMLQEDRRHDQDATKQTLQRRESRNRSRMFRA